MTPAVPARYVFFKKDSSGFGSSLRVSEEYSTISSTKSAINSYLRDSCEVYSVKQKMILPNNQITYVDTPYGAGGDCWEP